MKTFFVVPAREGLVVRDPASRQAIPAKGALKKQTPYWLRRIADGDVTVVEQPAATPAPVQTPETVQVEKLPDGSEVIRVPAPAKASKK